MSHDLDQTGCHRVKTATVLVVRSAAGLDLVLTQEAGSPCHDPGLQGGPDPTGSWKKS